MNKLRLKIAILSVALLTVTAGAAISPALGTIATAFPHASGTTIKLILTLPSLVIIPFIFVSSYLAKRIPKKQILFIGIALYFIGGVGAGMVSTIPALLFFRVLLGIGAGLIMPISTSLVADFYAGDERTKTMGQVSAVNNLSGVVLFIASGLLAAISWRTAFSVYLIAIPVLILVTFHLPATKPDPMKSSTTPSKPIPKKIYALSAAVFFLMMAFFSVPSNMALFMQQEGIGSSNYAGIVISMGTAAGFIAGFVMQKVKKVIKSYFVVTQLFLMAVGFFVMGYSYHMLIVALGVGLMGFGFGSIFPTILDEVTRHVSKEQTVQAMAIVTSMIFFGQFFSPLILDGVRILFANETIRFTYQFLGWVLLLGAGMSFIKNKSAKKEQKLHGL
ncbi:MFS transporter [bacterium LRH843]|nr:MFS transporter [bacterium LRH843]